MPFNRLIVIGFFGVLIGAILPFAIVIGFVESTFLTNLIAYLASMIGIFLGVIGTAMYVGDERRKPNWQQEDYWE